MIILLLIIDLTIQSNSNSTCFVSYSTQYERQETLMLPNSVLEISLPLDMSLECQHVIRILFLSIQNTATLLIESPYRDHTVVEFLDLKNGSRDFLVVVGEETEIELKAGEFLFFSTTPVFFFGTDVKALL